jgi:hypothetical protein
MDISNMNENVKLDIAIELMSSKIAKALQSKDKETVNKLLEERDQLYLGNWDIINKILEEYSEDVKK